MRLDDILKQCCICSEDFITADEIIKYPCECKYIYHKSCLLEWLGYPESGCPICRKPLLIFPLQEGIFTAGVNEITLTELDFVQTVSNISYLSSDDDLDSLDDWINDEYIPLNENPTTPLLPPIQPLQPLQLTPDNPLSAQQSHDFSTTFEHTFSIPLYIPQNVQHINLPQAPPTPQITPILTVPPTLPQPILPISPISSFDPPLPSITPTINQISTSNQTDTQDNTPITLQLFNENFGLNLNKHIH